MMNPQFPVNLNLERRPVLVVGGGRVALRKCQQLVVTGADVTVVSPNFVDGFQELGVRLVKRAFSDSDLDGIRLVITATGVRDVDQTVFDGAERRGIFVNSADDPDRCTFTLPATVRRGQLMITTSTNGSSPALSSFLRELLAGTFDEEWGDVVSDLATLRNEMHEQGISTETVDWRPIILELLDRRGVAIPSSLVEARR